METVDFFTRDQGTFSIDKTLLQRMEDVGQAVSKKLHRTAHSSIVASSKSSIDNIIVSYYSRSTTTINSITISHCTCSK